MADEEEFIPPDPLEIIPGYESDIRAVGTHRVADKDLVAAEKSWREEFSEEELRNAGLIP